MFGLTPYERRNRDLRAADRRPDADLFFDSFFRDALYPYSSVSLGQIRVDIRENEKEFIIDADLPGVARDQISLETRDGSLILSIHVDEKQETKGEGYICRERRTGTRARAFSLENIREDKITASLKDGILTVTLPKTEPALPDSRKIEIE